MTTSTTQRVSSNRQHVDANDEFIVDPKSRTFNQQYSNMYFVRLKQLLPRVKSAGQKRWPNIPFSDHTLNVGFKKCWVVGTLYKQMKLKPDVLVQVAASHYGEQLGDVTAWKPDPSDSLVLEDESGRMKLVGSILDKHILVTGAVIGAMGVQNADGEFEVEDIVFPAYPKGISGKDETKGTSARQKIALVSGLKFRNMHDFRRQLLLEWLTGDLAVDRESTRQISHLLIAGDSIGHEEPDLDYIGPVRFGYHPKSVDLQPMSAFDQFVADAARSISVSVMPGEEDPTSTALPQQPITSHLFGRAKQISSFYRESNPAWFNLDNVQIFGTSGQNVNNIYRYVDEEQFDRSDLVAATLMYNHSCPTAPDTLWCYPFTEYDPFVLQEMPQVYFVGNQPSFYRRKVEYDGKSTLVIGIPKFFETGEVVVLDLETFETELVVFK